MRGENYFKTTARPRFILKRAESWRSQQQQAALCVVRGYLYHQRQSITRFA